MKKKIRPLSPHLVVYKPQITSVFSIFHRVSGSSLSLFFILIIILLYFNFFFVNHFDFYSFMINYINFTYIVASSIGFFLVFIFCFHITNGIRHMLWDFGIGLELKNLTATSFFVFFINTLIITIIILL
jgi:succinate dehydrogenase / fumarate reductase cytochrome b subunit